MQQHQYHKIKLYSNIVDTDALDLEQWMHDVHKTLKTIDEAVLNQVMLSEKFGLDKITRIEYTFLDGTKIIPSNKRALQDDFISQRRLLVYLKDKEKPISVTIYLTFDSKEQAFSTTGNIYVNEVWGTGKQLKNLDDCYHYQERTYHLF